MYVVCLLPYRQTLGHFSKHGENQNVRSSQTRTVKIEILFKRPQKHYIDNRFVPPIQPVANPLFVSALNFKTSSYKMPKIVECVPNFSEGRDRKVCAKYDFIQQCMILADILAELFIASHASYMLKEKLRCSAFFLLTPPLLR